MMKKEPSIDSAWVDPDEAPPWTLDVFAMAEVREGERLIKAATGVLKRGRQKPERHPKYG